MNAACRRIVLPALACLFFLLPIGAIADSGAEAAPATILYDPAVLVRSKARYRQRDPAVMPAVAALLKDADRAVTAPPESVALKPEAPPGGDLHDYWSLAPCWWPDPARPLGMPWIRRGGRRNPEADSDRFDRQRMRRMSRDALTLAQAWFLTGNPQYAGKGSALVWSWCCDSLTMTNPNLAFARARPGTAGGSPGGIIETRDLIRVAEAARLLEPSVEWNQAETRRLTSWFKAYVDWLRNSDFGRIEAAASDHHATWFDAQVAVFALYAGERNLARAVVSAVVERLVDGQIRPDGTMPGELKRADSRHATYFNLEAFFILAAAGERLGVDLWHARAPHGGSIRAALDLAAPYLAPGGPWPYGRTGRFDPLPFIPLFHRAALVYKDTRYLDYLKALPAEGLRADRALLFH